MTSSRLIKWGDADFTAVGSPENIRGRWIIDRNGEEIGYIDDLLIDDQERKVRFLQVVPAGVVGTDRRRFLLPADAVTGVTDDEIMIDQTGAKIDGAPRYDPDVTYEQEYYDEMSRYYGYPPS